MTKINKIPKFASVKEEAKFWDTHDVTDYLSEMKEEKLSFDPLSPKEETVTIRIQSNLKKKLEKEARVYGVNISTLLRLWVIEKLKAGGL
ncbi:MAG: hypothetical protein UT63_C0018G0002 [Candidatus Gottesmanbacteria bacterium GW2011_GWC2_39_8]|uniref:CopG antitoxin of type II toxin-antitoxin system n=1 Tax=Candidatus Gottesmanbacteria bacterium GW2011_GWC2_39_8 TaxID=1618450 RepID=A0A0G0T6A7_9BACT|nr:MAG: hypothetical protein UT63_C0018G0002 [Candidatus Gottesmanbacteria bacterium GW2011_GWC2_39_8]